MAHSLPSPPAAAHANSLRGLRAQVSTARMGRQAVVDVIVRLHRSQKAFAVDAHCPESDLSNALRDRQRFDLDWVVNQDDEFLAAWIDAVEAARGLKSRALLGFSRADAVAAISRILDLVYGEEASA